jgi:hypothetical protein
MRHSLEIPAAPSSVNSRFLVPSGRQHNFRLRFRCALAQCVQRGFQVEECFGMIWEETLEEVELTCREQNELYPELIEWARRWIHQDGHAGVRGA